MFHPAILRDMQQRREEKAPSRDVPGQALRPCVFAREKKDECYPIKFHLQPLEIILFRSSGALAPFFTIVSIYISPHLGQRKKPIISTFLTFLMS
jgi:hypothetical protein